MLDFTWSNMAPDHLRPHHRVLQEESNVRRGHRHHCARTFWQNVGVTAEASLRHPQRPSSPVAPAARGTHSRTWPPPMHVRHQERLTDDFKSLQECPPTGLPCRALVPTFMTANCLTCANSREQPYRRTY